MPTAEGAIQLAMEELPITLHGARVLVIGYGRLGRVLADRLAGLKARVSVAARRYADLAWAENCGYGVEHTGQLEGWLCGYDLVVNTVPVRVLREAELADLKPGCLVIDLASKPGGVDFDAAARLGVKAFWALSLPGKVAPVTAGKSIKTTIYNILNLLVVTKTLGDQSGLVGVLLVVVGHDFYLHPLNSPGLVQLLRRHIGAQKHQLAIGGAGAGQRTANTELDCSGKALIPTAGHISLRLSGTAGAGRALLGTAS